MPDYTPPAGVAERRLTLRICGLEIPAALTLPATAPRTAILLIPGSLFADVNGDYPAWNSFPGASVSLAHQLAGRGHAVYRYAKSGPGTGTVVADKDAWDRERTWDGRVTIAAAAAAAMREAMAESSFDVPTVISGHSEGAVVALRLAQRVACAAAITFAAPAFGIITIMRQQVGRNAAPERRDATLAAFDEAIEYIKRGEAVPDRFKSVEGIGGMAMMPSDPTRYLAACEATDPRVEASRVACPLLVVQGGRDGNVTPDQADLLAAAHRPKPTERLLLPELSHTFKQVPPGTSQMDAFGLTGPCDERVANGVDAWLRGVA